jgi:hypothetical protein
MTPEDDYRCISAAIERLGMFGSGTEAGLTPSDQARYAAEALERVRTVAGNLRRERRELKAALDLWKSRAQRVGGIILTRMWESDDAAQKEGTDGEH